MKLIKNIYKKIEYIASGLVTWIGWVLSGNEKASSKRLAFLAVVTAGIVWLSADLHNHGITEQWVISFQTLVAFASGSYVVGVAVQKTKKRDDGDNSDNSNLPQ